MVITVANNQSGPRRVFPRESGPFGWCASIEIRGDKDHRRTDGELLEGSNSIWPSCTVHSSIPGSSLTNVVGIKLGAERVSVI
jgi:hypothetical protein